MSNKQYLTLSVGQAKPSTGISYLIPATAQVFCFVLVWFWLHWVFIAAQGLLFVAVCRLLIVVASLVVEHGL